MKICCMVSGLAAGGAERVMTLLANQWAALGRDVTIVTLATGMNDQYELDRRVKRLGLDLEIASRSPAEAVKHNVLKIRRLRRAVASLAPNVLISFVDKVNVLAVLSCVGLGVRVIISERTHPGSHRIGRAWSLLRRLSYPLADALVVQSEATRVWAEAALPACRTHVIPNPVGGDFSGTTESSSRPRRPIVLGLGRLSPEKGFDLLIKAFHSVAQRHAEWSLVIVGQGPKERELKELAAKLLPPGAVLFPGPVKDPGHYYRAAGLFVLSSRFEGFPNALLEAMASGCAVIATNSPGGTSEIVRHGIDGLLIPQEDVGALSKAMDRLMTDGSERRRLAAGAVEVATRFGIDRIIRLWEDVISQVRR